MSQSPKQVIDSVFDRAAPDRYPSTFSAQSVAVYRAGYTMERFMNLPPAEQARFSYDTAKEHGGDFLHIGLGGTVAVAALGGKIKFRAHGPADVEEPLVKSIADLDKVDIGKVRQYHYYQTALETARHIVALAGGEYHIQTGSWGIFTQAGLFYGAERLMRAVVKDKQAVYALLDFTLEFYKSLVGGFIDLGATYGGGADPTSSGDLISKRAFEEFSLPYLRKTYEWYRSRGLKTQLHICGDINDRVDLIPDTLTDALSVDYKVDILRAAGILDGRVIIGGNADPATSILTGSPESLRREYGAIADSLEGYPYIIMPGCGIPQHTPLENIDAVNAFARSRAPAPYAHTGRRP
ncbi:MAG: uroporphyrinogen decarboxylase [Oscillospiraceae bacterium]|jgi:uroporphyrinogen decarboxylase|nr:uroporphyrinogen decarboxylase [Oscillospiraceae bacterium]